MRSLMKESFAFKNAATFIVNSDLYFCRSNTLSSSAMRWLHYSASSSKGSKLKMSEKLTYLESTY